MNNSIINNLFNGNYIVIVIYIVIKKKLQFISNKIFLYKS